MATYKDYQTLAAKIYDFGKLDENGKDVTLSVTVQNGTDPEDKTTWTKVLDQNNPNSGYYGAVYTNDSGEYILVNRGTDITSSADLSNDGQMVAGAIPDQYDDAKKLMEQAKTLDGTLTIAGHSLGGSLSQMLSIEYGNKVVTFNPFNTKEIIDGVIAKNYDYASLTQQSTDIQTQIDVLAAKADALTTEEKLQLGQLQTQKNTIDEQLATQGLVKGYQAGNSDNMVNYVIKGDPVSFWVEKSQFGETITIEFVGKNIAEPGGNTSPDNTAQNGADFGGELWNLNYHFMKNFATDSLLSYEKEINVSTNNGSLDDKYELGVVEFFKDKTKYEIDKTNSSSKEVNISHDWELYILQAGSVKTGATTDLITDVHDSAYSNSSFSLRGEQAKIQKIAQSLVDNPPTGFMVVRDTVENQEYIKVLPLPETLPPLSLTTLRKLDPLVLDLDNDNIETLSVGAGIKFDHDNDGIASATDWIRGDDGFLVRDINHDGKITNGTELFGENTIKKDGTTAKDAFDALQDIDSNQDGIIDKNDAVFSELKIWRDRNMDGETQADELKTLTEMEISSINTRSLGGATTMPNGVEVLGFSSYTKLDGENRQTAALNLREDKFYNKFLDKPDTNDLTNMSNTGDLLNVPDINGAGAVRNLRDAMMLNDDLLSLVKSWNAATGDKVSLTQNIVSQWANTSSMVTSPMQYAFFNADSSLLNKLSIIEKFAGTTSPLITEFIGNMGLSPEEFKRLENKIVMDGATAQAINNNYTKLVAAVGDGLTSYQEKQQLIDNFIWNLNDQKLSVDSQNVLSLANNSNNVIQEIIEIANAQQLIMQSNDLNSQTQSNTLLMWLTEKLTSENSWTAVTFNHVGDDSDNMFFGNGIPEESFYTGDGDDMVFANDNSVNPNLVTKNLVVLGDGNDEVFVRGDYNVVTTGNGNDMVFGQNSGFNVIATGDGDDEIYGTTTQGSAIVLAGSGNDSIYASDGSNYIYGEDGDDYIEGGNGNDHIIGGHGNDLLIGGGGNDIYHFSYGDGIDRIRETDDGSEFAEDSIWYDSAITQDDIALEKQGDDLIIRLKNSEDYQLIEKWFSGDAYRVETLRFGDGSFIDLEDVLLKDSKFITGSAEIYDPNIYGTIADDLLIGNDHDNNIYALDGNDVIYAKNGNDRIEAGNGDNIIFAGAGDDQLIVQEGNNILNGELGDDLIDASASNGYNTITGGLGDDDLLGGGGNDDYFFNRGDGYDTITEKDGDMDQIIFGEGIALGDLKFSTDLNNLSISVPDSDMSVWINNFFQSKGSYLEQIVFADKSIFKLDDILNHGLTISINTSLDKYSAGIGNDEIYIRSKVNSVVGGRGDDVIYNQGMQPCTYEFYLGDGHDTIYFSSISDTIYFGNGIKQEDLSFSRSLSGLVIDIGNDGEDQVTIADYFSNRIYQLSKITFAEDNPLFIAEIKNQELSYFGSNSEENIYGWNGVDIIHGAEGNDTINGSNGNDILYGDGGNDYIIGGLGSDLLDGGEGDDILEDSALYFNEGNIFIGGKGNDVITGGYGNNVFIFNSGDGQDTITNYDTSNIIRFGDGIRKEDLRFVRSGDDMIIALNGTDQITVTSWFPNNFSRRINKLSFSDGSMVFSYDLIAQNGLGIKLNGDIGNDSLVGTFTKDLLNGNAGNDTLTANGGNDVLNGGTGNDTLFGGSGDDSYVYALGDGADIINETSGSDSLILNNISKENLLFTQNNDDLIISFKDNSSDQITVSNWFISLDNQLEKLQIGADEFDLLQMVEEQLNVKTGTAGDDALELINNQTKAIGGTGDDIIHDATSHDTTYVYNRGDGKDTIIDSDSTNDIILFGENIAAGDLKYTKSGADLVITLGDSEQITIKDYAWAANRIEILQFNDGSSLNLAEQLQTAGMLNPTKITTSNSDDTLWLNKGATINLREGNNSLYLTNPENTINSSISAGSGNDTVVIEGNAGNRVSLGNGNNLATISGTTNSVTAGNGSDTINIASSIKTTVNAGNGDNVIHVTATDSTTIDSITSGTGNDTIFITEGTATIRDLGGNNDIRYNGSGKVSITSGSGDDEININQAASATINSGAGNDKITASRNNDIIYAKDGDDEIDGNVGNDKIYAGSGNDIIRGGAGDDLLYGESGDDEYFFNRGDGKDTILDSSGTDEIIFASDINAEDLTFTKSGNNLIITIDENNQLTIKNHFHSSNSYRLEMLTFGDGSQMDTDALIRQNGLNGTANNETMTGTGEADKLLGNAGNDRLYGKDGNDLLSGGEGNDYLYGEAGNDTLIGGQGNDVMYGGAGDDTYILSAGDGKDTISDNEGHTAITFDKSINKEDLWFSQKGADLIITNTQTQDQITVKKAYSWLTGDDPYAIIRSDAEVMESIMSGKEILKMTQDLARLGATPMAQSEMNATQKEEFAKIISSNWMVDGSK